MIFNPAWQRRDYSDIDSIEKKLGANRDPSTWKEKEERTADGKFRRLTVET